MKLISLISTLLAFQAGFAQTQYLLAGTYTKMGKSKGIYVYKFNSQTGETSLVGSAAAENPSFLAVSPDNRHVYAVNENPAGIGTISTFSFNTDNGALHFISKQSTFGADPCYIGIDPENKWVAVANYTEGSFSVFPIDKDAILGPAAQIIRHTGSSINKDRQEKAHVHSTVFSFDNHFLTVADLGMDKIMVYPFDANSKRPVTEAEEINTAPGSGPRHIIFNPHHPFAYLIEELSGNINSYKYSSGKFERIQTISAHPADFKGEKASAAIHFSDDGKFLYASNRGASNTIAIFSVDAVSGKLSPKGFQPSGGDHPRDFTIDASGKFLLAGNMKTGSINIFSRDRETGLLKDSGRKIAVPAPTCLLFIHIK